MGNRLDEAVEKAGDLVDRTVPHAAPDTDGYDDAAITDSRVTSIFPYFVMICLMFWIAGMVATECNGIAKCIELLCLSFTMCFTVLGIALFQRMQNGLFSKYRIGAIAFLMTALIWVVNYITSEFYFADSVRGILNYFGIYPAENTIFIIGFLVTYCVILFTATGVITVICSYLRIYIPNVLSSMNDHARNGVRMKSERFFMIPEIVDVERIVLDPPEQKHIFDVRGLISLSSYIFILGLLISSYIFINPIFLDVMEPKIMLAITIMLSMFAPALILPWQIFRIIGAYAETAATRPYPLWQGAKYRLFSAFTTMGAFMMMLCLSVYLGNDIWSIISSYLTFMVPLFCISLMYGILYINNFERVDILAIQERLN